MHGVYGALILKGRNGVPLFSRFVVFPSFPVEHAQILEYYRIFFLKIVIHSVYTCASLFYLYTFLKQL